jgi:hypothetical protein
VRAAYDPNMQSRVNEFRRWITEHVEGAAHGSP